MKSYCLKCLMKTKNLKEKIRDNRICSICSQCGSRKSCFLPSRKGSGIASKLVQKTLNAYRKRYCSGKARPLYEGEMHYGCHNYSGPGTKIDRPDVASYPPYNNIDNCSRLHDLDYNMAKTPQDIRAADLKVLECYDKYKDENGYGPSRFFIGKKVQAEKISPKIIGLLLGKEYIGS